MTVIAWDGHTLAGDRRMTVYGTAVTVQKIFRVGDDRLVGFSGSGKRSGALLEWLKQGADPEKYPPNPPDDACHMLVIHRDGRILRYEDAPHPIDLPGPHAALGSGLESAMVAMHLGCTAAQAVEVVSLFDVGCGNGIDALTFDAMPVTASDPAVVATITSVA